MSDCLGTDSAGTGPTIPPATGPLRWESRIRGRRAADLPLGPERPASQGGEPRGGSVPKDGRAHRAEAATAADMSQERRYRPGPGPFAAIQKADPEDRNTSVGSIGAPRDERSVTLGAKAGKKKVSYAMSFWNE